MILIKKEAFSSLKIYEGDWLSAKTWATVRPLFWDKDGADEVVINYRGTPSPELIKIAEEFQKKISDQLVGKSQKVMVDWLEKEEFEETR